MIRPLRVVLFAGCMLGIATSPALAAPEVLQLTAGNMLAQTHSRSLLFTITGTYRQLTGTLTFDPVARTCTVNTLFQTRSLALPNSIVRGQVMSKGFLDPDQYPTSSYTGHCVDNATELAGDLTMHGQTHPFTMKVTFRKTNGRLTAIDTKGSLNRFEWGWTEWRRPRARSSP